MSKVTAAIEAKNKSQNLFEFFGNLPKEFKYDKIGLSSDFYEDKSSNTKEYPEYSKVFIIRTGYRDPAIVNEYFQKFINGKLKPEPYFTKKDGDVYWLVKRFFESRINTQESDKNLANLARHFNVLNRQVNNDLYKKYDSLGDKLAAPAVRKAYYTGKCNGKQNPLKEAAWIVVHSYVIDRFFSENYQYRLIPKHQELVPLWNSYINSMEDIPDIVKKYYILNEKCESPFTYHYKNETLKENEKDQEEKSVTITGYISTDPVMDEHPMDDKEPGAVEENVSEETPFEEAVVVNNSSDTISEAVNKVLDIVNNEKKEEKIIDGKFEQVKDQTPKKEEKKEEKIIDGKFEQVKEDPAPKKEEKKEETLQKKIYKRPDEPDEMIKKNNEDAEGFVNKLDRFTNLCRNNGYSVFYSNNQWYPNLVQAFIFSRSNSEDKRYVLLDPCIIYGDTLRVIHMKDHEGARKGTFVAISQKDLVEKIIKGTFDKDDRKKNMDQLPKVLGDYRDKYIFIDRIDLHNLQELTRKEDGRSISFNEWKKLIINVSNVFKNSEIPVCRFRITEIKDCNHFKMICDDKVQIFYKSTLGQEDSHIKAAQGNFWVDYDVDKYKDSNYIFGIINNN